MNFKQLLGIIFFAVGIILIIFAFYSLYQEPEQKGFFKDVENFFTHNPMWNPLIEFFGGAPQEKLEEKNNLSAIIALILGIIFATAGGAIVFAYRKKV